MSLIQEVARAIVSDYLLRHSIDPWGLAYHAPEAWQESAVVTPPNSPVLILEYPFGDTVRVFSTIEGLFTLRSELTWLLMEARLGLREASVWHSYIVQLPPK